MDIYGSREKRCCVKLKQKKKATCCTHHKKVSLCPGRIGCFGLSVCKASVGSE